MKLLGILLTAGFLLTGCDERAAYDRQIEKMSQENSGEVGLAKTYLDDLQARNFDPIKQNFNTAYVSNADAMLPRLADEFPAGMPVKVTLIGLRKTYMRSIRGKKSTITTIDFEYQFPEKWAEAQIVLTTADTKTMISGLHVARSNQSFEDANKFSLKNKSLLCYIFLGAAILIPLLTIYVAILCIRTKSLRRKWLWVIFILSGFASAALDWTSGEVRFNLLNFQLLGSGYFRTSPYYPVILSISLPLGALLFLLLRKDQSQKLRTPPTV